MKRAKEKVQELLNDSKKGISEQDYRKHMQELKPKINNLLMEYLPNEISIRDADILGMVMLEIITNPNDFLTA